MENNDNSTEPSAQNELEQLIQGVAKRAQISDSSAEYVVDMVLAAVKKKLPPEIASRLVRVMAGEETYSHGETLRKDTQTDSLGDTFEDVTDRLSGGAGRVIEDATRIGGKAFEEFGRVGARAVDEANDTAMRVSRWAKDMLKKDKD